jgi:dethiobiotin synthetase
MKSIFIAGTDTGVGKTMVSALLLNFLRGQGIHAGYQKWVSTGDADSAADLDFCRRTAGPEEEPAPLEFQSPYRFAFPASPHFAAEREGRAIEVGKILSAYEEMAFRYQCLLVEGVGGVLVPLRRDLLLADLLAGMQLPVLVVARTGLGTLNHTFLTLEALRARRIEILGVVFSDGQEAADEKIAADNLKTVAEIGRVKVFGRLPRCLTPAELKREFQPIGQAFFKNFKEA